MGLFVVFRRKIIVIQALSLLCSGPFGPVFRPGGRPTRGLGPFRACKRRHPEHVVRKERREYLRLRPCLADCPHEQFVVSLDPAEHVLYAASCARLPCVAFCLERGERFSAEALLADVLAVAFRQRVGTAYVAAVCPHVLARIPVAIQQLSVDVAVMDAGCRDDYVAYDLVLVVGDDMRLVAEGVCPVLAAPAGIDILLCGLRGLFLPRLGFLPFLYGLVLVGLVALDRDVHDSGVDDGAAPGEQALLLEHPVELPEQFLPDARPYEHLAVVPYRLCVGYGPVEAQVQETHERQPVLDLVFHLVVGEVVEALQDENLQHETQAERLSARVAFDPAVRQVLRFRLEQDTVELAPVHNLVEHLERVADL